MIIKIEVKSLVVRQQITQSKKTLHWQIVGMDSGSDWPVVFEIFLPEGRPLPIGQHQYEIVFRASQYNQLEIDPFNGKVVPAK